MVAVICSRHPGTDPAAENPESENPRLGRGGAVGALGAGIVRGWHQEKGRRGPRFGTKAMG